MATWAPCQCTGATSGTPVAKLAVTPISWEATAAFPDTPGASPDTPGASPATSGASPDTPVTKP
jgi:hypothetical protein